MKNRIEKKFKELQKEKKKAFVAFITAGDPNLKVTEKAIYTLEEAGVDILELGVPFSDPMADGPVIQRSSERALISGTNLRGILALVKKVRRVSEIPILLMGYFNPVFQYGVREYFRDAKRAGVDGTLLVDLPPEEGEEVRREANREGVSLIFLLAPTSDAKRINLVKRKGSGFIYYVSLTGITGADLSRHLGSQQALKTLHQKSPLPVCVGFGVKTPDQARDVARFGEGVVVGSALVQIFEKNKGTKILPPLKKLATRLAESVHSVF